MKKKKNNYTNFKLDHLRKIEASLFEIFQWVEKLKFTRRQTVTRQCYNWKFFFFTRFDI